jgi:vitamin B12 transporter
MTASRRWVAPFLLLWVLLPALPQDIEDDGFPLDDEFVLDMEGEGITITASPETTQQMKVIPREEIERRHAPDLPVLLAETLGLGTTSYGPYGNMTDVNLRGFDTERIAVLIDGIPVNSPRSGEFDFTQVDVNSVERIEVIYGGSDTKYNVSGALGGVINIITVKKQNPGLRIGGSVSNTAALPGGYTDWDGFPGTPQWQDLADAQNASVSAGFGAEGYSWSANAFANRAGNHFLHPDDYDTIRRKEGNEVWDAGASASLVRDFADLSKLIAGADLYYGDKHIPVSGYTSEAALQQDFSTRQNIMFEMPRAFRDDLAAEMSLSHTWGTLRYDPGRNASLHDEHYLTAISRWSWYLLPPLTLKAGADYRYIHIDSTNDGIHDRHNGGVYLTAEYQPLKGFLLIPSVKLATEGAGIVPVPKLGFVLNLTDTLTLKNNYFRSFKFPDFDDLYWVQEGFSGNPDLLPEDGFGGDLSLEYRGADRISIDTTLYAEWTRNSIHWNNAAGFWTPQNAGEASFFGADTTVSFEIPLSRGPIEKIVPSLSYQYLLSYLLSDGRGYGSDKRIPYMPAHTAGLSLDIRWNLGDRAGSGGRAGSLVISGHYESRRYGDTENSPALELDPYVLLTINGSQKLGNNITTFAIIRNALNWPYESFAGYPMPGLTLTVGMRVQFDGLFKED